MTKIKICGLCRPKDIEAVNLYKPDYVGFVFAQSKRRVSAETAKELISSLDKSIKKVGVFVNEDLEKIKYVADLCGLDVLQLHGDETAESINDLKKVVNCQFWKAIRIRTKEDLEKIPLYSVNRVLLDTYKKELYGGSGENFNWGLLDGIERGNIILAGGLNVDNVSEAIKTVSPYMLDISSGAETDGVKDACKINEIMRLVKGAK